MNFKIGDRVRKIGKNCVTSKAGQEYTVVKCSFEGCKGGLAIASELHNEACHCQNEWELLTNQNNNMKSLKGLMSRLLDKDTQVLYKAEYINGDLELTQKGKDKIVELLFLDKKIELVKLAEEDLKEAEAKK